VEDEALRKTSELGSATKQLCGNAAQLLRTVKLDRIKEKTKKS
jgi:hypothetical protein